MATLCGRQLRLCEWLFDHLVRAQQDAVGSSTPITFAVFRLTDELEFVRPLDRKICGFRTVDNLGKVVG
jgi:hypothetical protein